MSTDQAKIFGQINNLYEKASDLTYSYWLSYSGLTTWQFWVLLGMTVLPLVALYFLMDRTKAFHLGFYGYSFHMFFHYVDTYGFTNGLWGYPFKWIPFLPTSIALDTSFVPVSFMLVYQWTLNQKKNYYLYTTALSLLFSFLFKPAMVAFGLFQLYKGVNYFHLFVVYMFITLISKLLTNLFAHFQGEAREVKEHSEAPIAVKRRTYLSRFFHLKQKAK